MIQGDPHAMVPEDAAMETMTASPPKAATDQAPQAAVAPPEAAEATVQNAEIKATAAESYAAAAGAAEGHQPHHQWAQQTLPPGYAVDPVSGQVVFVGLVYQQPIYQQPVPPPQPGVVYVQAETPEQAAARQALEQQRYGQIMQSFERFVQGETTVSDLVKTLYTNTAQYDQLWKGALVGAAATVLLTSKPVREAMGKTFGSVFPGLKPQQKASGAPASTTVDPLKSGKE
nr:hypothetical protein [uncultured Desulfobulbus sp.]